MAHISSITDWRPGRGTWLLGALAALIAALLVTAGISSLAWGSTLRDEGRLLPGTTIAGVDVGDQTLEEARAAVAARLEPRLVRTVELAYDDQRWAVTARELGAATDADAVLDEAFERTMEAGLTELTRMRWAGATIGPDLDVALGIPDEAVEGFVTTIADEIDRDPRDAAVAWTGDGLEITDGHEGREVETEETAAALSAAIGGDGQRIDVLVEHTEPDVTSAAAEAAVEELAPRVATALDHTVAVTHDATTWSTSPRDLDATPQFEPALEALLDGEEPDRVAVSIPEESLAGFVASIADGIDLAPRNAEVALHGDGLDITPERDGRVLDRDEATADLRRALGGEDHEIGVTVRPTRASVTTASFDRVLVLRQDERELELYENLEPTRSWPVAVGMGGSPTPTGTFTVGAKRFEPTWNNPSPDGWGSDMPERIGPGPDNPLGTRAINWNQHGRDTLIRFHGTPNEDSIGEAASQGCVRMFNSDVEELYELVSTGTVILSAS